MSAIIQSNKTDKVKGLLGNKIAMTTYIKEDGAAIPVTVVKAGPCAVTQVKTPEKDGYSAAQIGYLETKRVIKPLAGHFKKNNTPNFKKLKEFKVTELPEVAQWVTVETFKEGDRVDVTGISRGRGLTGVVKRWGFAGGHKTHGGNVHRLPGSSGQGTFPGRIFKGKKYPGRYGNKQITAQNLIIVKVLPEENALLIKGAIPGPQNGLIQIRAAVKSR